MSCGVGAAGFTGAAGASLVERGKKPHGGSTQPTPPIVETVDEKGDSLEPLQLDPRLIPINDSCHPFFPSLGLPGGAAELQSRPAFFRKEKPLDRVAMGDGETSCAWREGKIDQKQFSRDVMAKLVRGGYRLALTRDGDPKEHRSKRKTRRLSNGEERKTGFTSREGREQGVRRTKRSGYQP
jgi:hypothetical protein